MDFKMCYLCGSKLIKIDEKEICPIHGILEVEEEKEGERGYIG